MHEPLLSIIVPIHNTEEFIAAILNRVLNLDLSAVLPQPSSLELILVDDASIDGSYEITQEFLAARPSAPIKVFRHERSRGTGAAIRTGVENASGKYSIIQYPTLEYDPREYPSLLQPLLTDQADVVYGSRFLTTSKRRVSGFRHALVNKALTNFCNIAADLDLTDSQTGFKAFRTSLVQSIPLKSDSEEIHTELSIKFAKRQARIYEVALQFRDASYIPSHMPDEMRVLAAVLRYWFSSDIYKDHGPEILDSLSHADRFNRWMADTVSPYLGQDVLELGAGMGNLSRHLARRRRRYIASDIDLEHLARLKTRLSHRPNFETAICDLTDASYFRQWRGTLDSVVCLNVLEHTDNDMAGLENLYSSLRQGGRAVVLVPQGSRVYGSLDRVLGHFRRYSKSELEQKMAAVGFRVEKVIEFNRITYPGWYVNGRILKKEKFSRVQLRIFDRLVWLWRRIDPVLPWPPTSIIGVGVRDR